MLRCRRRLLPERPESTYSRVLIHPARTSIRSYSAAPIQRSGLMGRHRPARPDRQLGPDNYASGGRGNFQFQGGKLSVHCEHGRWRRLIRWRADLYALGAARSSPIAIVKNLRQATPDQLDYFQAQGGRRGPAFMDARSLGRDSVETMICGLRVVTRSGIQISHA